MILDLQTIVSCSKVTLLDNDISLSCSCNIHGVSDCPYALTSHQRDIVLQVLDQALDDTCFDALLDALWRLCRNVSQRPGCLLAHDLLRVRHAFIQ